MKKIFLGIVAIAVLTSCEDAISVEVEAGETQLSIDGFLNNKNEKQLIQLKQTKQFFEQSSQVGFIADSVYVLDNLNNKYLFESPLSDGDYIWNDSVMIFPGRTYSLTIKSEGLTYTATSVANEVPVIDSLNWEYVPAGLGQKNGSYAVELVARDLPGQLNYYWIRFLKEGEYDTRIEGLNFSVDGSFSETSQGDGQLFIPPISTLVAYDVEDSVGLGDNVTYEIWGITPETYSFWQEVSNQAIQGGGIGALFATPTANVNTNIISPNTGDVKNKAVGWFSTSVVESATDVIVDRDYEKLSFEI